MFAEQLVIDMPTVDVTAVPDWAWWVAAVCLWYPLAGLAVRMAANRGMFDKSDSPTVERVSVWVFSPVLAAIIVGLVVFLLLWALVVVVSLGGVPFPWSKGRLQPENPDGKLIPPQGGSSSAPPTEKRCDPPTAGELGL